MADVTELIREIKRTAVSAMDAAKPCGVFFGTVKSVSPLEITVEQKLTLGAEQLILSRAVTDCETEITLDFDTAPQKHKVRIHNALKVGERVVLIRLTGGQSYLIADRAGD